MNIVERFSLLVLEPDEIFFSDHAVEYIYPKRLNECDKAWEKLQVDTFIKGRLKVCSKSLVFDPRVKEVPLLKFPLKSCTLIQKGVPQASSQESIYYKGDDNVIVIYCDATVEMLDMNVIKPYNFVRESLCHTFELTFKKTSDVLPQILQLQRASTLSPNDQNVMLEAMVRSLENRVSSTWPADIISLNRSSNSINEFCVRRITPLVSEPAKIMLATNAVFYQPFNSLEAENSLLRIPLEDIQYIHRRRYLHKHVGFEIFYNERSFKRHLYIVFKSKDDRESLLSCSALSEKVLDAAHRLPLTTYKWQVGLTSNFEYLEQLNSLADRSRNDLTQYPVFPWVLSDYESSSLDLTNPDVFRDLSKPIGALNKRRIQALKERREEMCDPKFLYGSHYSTPAFVLFYLIRERPLVALCLHGGRFDHPDRVFNSLGETWRNVTSVSSDFKELIPEFYDPTEGGTFLRNERAIAFGTRHHGEPVWHVQIPPWAKNSTDLVLKLRAALESNAVSCTLHGWIDLVFGYKQRGKHADEADNVFHPLCYEGSVDLELITDLNERLRLEQQICEFGQVPTQLFYDPHSNKSEELSLYHDEAFRDTLWPGKSMKKEGRDGGMLRIPPLLSLVHFLERIVPLKDARPHTTAVTSLAFVTEAPTQTVALVSTDAAGKLRSMQAPSLKGAGSLDSNSLAFSSCVQVGGTSELLVGCWDNCLHRFNYKLCQKKDPSEVHSDAVTCLDSNRRFLVTGSCDCLVRVWLLPFGSPVSVSGWSRFRPHADALWRQMEHEAPLTKVALRWSEADAEGGEGEVGLATATAEGVVALWTLASERCVASAEEAHPGGASALCWDSYGSRVLSGGADGRVVLWETPTLQKILEINLQSPVRDLVFDGRTFVAALEAGALMWWDAAAERLLRRFNNAHAGAVTALSLSADSRWLCSGGVDGRVVLWGISEEQD